MAQFSHPEICQEMSVNMGNVSSRHLRPDFGVKGTLNAPAVDENVGSKE
jgi:hypothetical protein